MTIQFIRPDCSRMTTSMQPVCFVAVPEVNTLAGTAPVSYEALMLRSG